MGNNDIAKSIINGTVISMDKDIEIGEIPWNEHPKFKGVFLKHILTSIHTDGMLSCHMVKIDPHAILDNHVHENQWEIHEVIEGEGSFIMGTKDNCYYPGLMSIIPKGTKHKVIAGDCGMVLLAKFFPALV